MNLNKRVSWSIHITMGCVYLGIISSDMAGWFAARDAILLSGLAFCGLGIIACGVLWIIGRRRLFRRELPTAGRGPSSSGLALNNLLASEKSAVVCRVSRRERLVGTATISPETADQGANPCPPDEPVSR